MLIEGIDPKLVLAAMRLFPVIQPPQRFLIAAKTLFHERSTGLDEASPEQLAKQNHKR